MTKREWAALGRYVRWAADTMELRDWTFEIAHDPPDPDANARINLTYARKLAVVRFCSDFRQMPAEQQRHTVVHELVHCHLESATNMVLNDLEGHLAKPTDQIFWEGFKRQIEYGVDALASTIAKHLPLIAWPKA